MSRPRRQRVVFAFSGLLLVFLACVFVGELAVKLYFFGWYDSPKKILIPSDNPKLIYQLKPDTTLHTRYLNPAQTDWEYRARINTEGFRGPLPARPMRRPVLVILGDSFAFGLGVNDGESFPSRLAERFGNRASVLNWGVPAYNLVQSVALYEERNPNYDIDVVAFALHWNDFDAPVFRSAEDVRYVRWSHLYSIYRHLRWLAYEDQEAETRDQRQARVAAGLGAFEALQEKSSQRDQTLILLMTSCWDFFQGTEHMALLQRAKALGVPIIGPDGPICSQLDENSIPADGHPTATGHLLLADFLYTELSARLPGSSPATPPQ